MEWTVEEVICPVCNGSGESRFGPVGKGWCEMCGGEGILREVFYDYADFEDEFANLEG